MQKKRESKTERAWQINQEKTSVFSINGPGTVSYSNEKIKLYPYIALYVRINSRWTKNLNTIRKRHKTLKNNKGKYIYDFKVYSEKYFLNKTQKT